MTNTMSSIIKTPNEIKKMKTVGQLVSDLLEMVGEFVKEGITTNELDSICYNYIIKEQKAFPSLLNYKNYPKSICTSLNHQICHGIPSNRILKSGDILNIDVTINKYGYHADSSKMFFIGKINPLAKNLVTVSKECLYLGIKEVKPGGKIGDIGEAIQKHAEINNFSVVREYCGHGIGKNIHESPNILHYGEKNTGELLKPGMVFTIEPMINAGKQHTKLLKDKWTVVTSDHSLSSQWEHTIAVTNNGHEVLT